jgi:branched-chain amino acid transport system substrate-binding protein
MRFLAAIAATILACTFTAHAQSTQSSDPIKLGAILDMSGPYSDSTGEGSVTAARMAIEDFGGKLLGHPIQLLSVDHQNKPEIAVTIASRWYDAEGVTAILDVTTSSAALGVMNVANQRHKIVMLPSVGALAITNQNCIPTAVQWTFTTYGQAHTVAHALLQQGGKTWFFITADYVFGHALQDDTTAVVKANGGKVLGSVMAPLGNTEFAPMLITAQQSGADVIALALGSGDVANALKQATEFGITGKHRIALLGATIHDIHGMGLQVVQNVLMPDMFYWNTDDLTRDWSKRFYEQMHKMPSSQQAGIYSSTMNYLRAVAAVGTTDAAPVMQKLRETPVNDFFARNGHVRIDGLMAHDMHLYRIKTPAESKGPWDYYDLVADIPADQVSLPLSESKCPLVTQQKQSAQGR